MCNLTFLECLLAEYYDHDYEKASHTHTYFNLSSVSLLALVFSSSYHGLTMVPKGGGGGGGTS